MVTPMEHVEFLSMSGKNYVEHNRLTGNLDLVNDG